MRTYISLFLIAALMLTSVGCSVSRSSNGRFTTRWRIWESIMDSFNRDDAPQFSDADALWRNGYGFNNPNIARKRAGLPPVNFDGSVDR